MGLSTNSTGGGLVKAKGKVHPVTDYEGAGVYRHSSTLSVTSALNGCGWSTPRPGRFTLLAPEFDI
jgi:hypothetical protein